MAINAPFMNVACMHAFRLTLIVCLCSCAKRCRYWLGYRPVQFFPVPYHFVFLHHVQIDHTRLFAGFLLSVGH